MYQTPHSSLELLDITAPDNAQTILVITMYITIEYEDIGFFILHPGFLLRKKDTIV